MDEERLGHNAHAQYIAPGVIGGFSAGGLAKGVK